MDYFLTLSVQFMILSTEQNKERNDEKDEEKGIRGIKRLLCYYWTEFLFLIKVVLLVHMICFSGTFLTFNCLVEIFIGILSSFVTAFPGHVQFSLRVIPHSTGTVFIHPLLKSSHILFGNWFLRSCHCVLEILCGYRKIHLLSFYLSNLRGSASRDLTAHRHHCSVTRTDLIWLCNFPKDNRTPCYNKIIDLNSPTNITDIRSCVSLHLFRNEICLQSRRHIHSL